MKSPFGKHKKQESKVEVSRELPPPKPKKPVKLAKGNPLTEEESKKIIYETLDTLERVFPNQDAYDYSKDIIGKIIEQKKIPLYEKEAIATAGAARYIGGILRGGRLVQREISEVIELRETYISKHYKILAREIAAF